MTARGIPTGGLSRRTVLKAAGVGGGIVLGTRNAVECRGGKRPKPGPHTVHEGDAVEVGDGELVAYATTNPAGNLSSLGVHLDGDAFASFAEGGSHRDQVVAAHPHFPTETKTGDPLDHQFTFTGFHYNPQGHAPPGIYTVPHFDFHFYTLEESTVQGISGGPLGDAQVPFIGMADYEIPDAQFPPGYTFEQHRLIIKGMGEHLLDGTAPEFNGEDFTHTNVYGIYDPAIDPENPARTETIQLGGEEMDVPVYEGDGQGRVHFVEPMITTDFIANELDGEEEVGVATPARFAEAGEYPTTYVMKPDCQGGVFVAIDGFESFPGPADGGSGGSAGGD